MLYYFSEHLRRNSTGRSQQSFWSSIEISAGRRLVLLDPFSLVGAGTLKESFASQITALVDLLSAHFVAATYAASVKKGATEEKVWNNVSNNDLFKECLSQSLSDTCCARRITA